MSEMDEASFAKKLTLYSRFIGYVPMKDEPDYADFLNTFGIVVQQKIIPADPTLDPFELAKKMSGTDKKQSVAMFIPGQRFDVYGTRHGRGHGWYDRFLSQVPREWLRVGVTDAKHLSLEKLERKSWDEPMDVLLISEDDRWRVMSPEDGS